MEMRGSETNAPRRFYLAILRIWISVPHGRRASLHILRAFRHFPGELPANVHSSLRQGALLDCIKYPEYPPRITFAFLSFSPQDPMRLSVCPPEFWAQSFTTHTCCPGRDRRAPSLTGEA